MTRRERLMRTLRGQSVDRPPVSFYEIGGFDINRADPDRFNIYNSPSWQPLLDLAERETDVIRMRAPRLIPTSRNNADDFFRTTTWEEGDSRFTRVTLNIAGRTMTSLSRRDAGIDTDWQIEHLLKDTDDLRAYLELPDHGLGLRRGCLAHARRRQGCRRRRHRHGRRGRSHLLCRSALLDGRLHRRRAH